MRPSREPVGYIRLEDRGEARVPFDADAIAGALADEARGRRQDWERERWKLKPTSELI